MTTLSCRVDYLRATTTNEGAIIDAAQGFFSDEQTVEAIPLYGYKHALKHTTTGAVYLFGGHTASMGNCIQFGGSAITSLMGETSHPSCVALSGVVDDRWKVTRVDVAIDCFHPELRPRHVYAALDRKNVRTVWRSWREVANKDLDTGHTVYGGGLESERRIRIYDKSAEQGTEGLWTRYEMVFSGDRAAEVWKNVAKCEDDGVLLIIAKQLLATLLDFPSWREWQETFGVLSQHEWTPIPRVESDEWRWLASQVMPTFRKSFDKTGNWELLERFMRECKGSIE